MHLVVELFFDPATEAAVSATQRTLAEETALEPLADGARPHISITVYGELDVVGFRTALAAFAAERPALGVSLESWGVFSGPECVVFLAPVVTQDLLALHDSFQEQFATFGASRPYYRVGNWVPHCTLAAGFAADLLPTVAWVCHRLVRPVHGRIESIGLVQYSPRQEHFAFDLEGCGHVRR